MCMYMYIFQYSYICRPYLDMDVLWCSNVKGASIVGAPTHNRDDETCEIEVIDKEYIQNTVVKSVIVSRNQS